MFTTATPRGKTDAPFKLMREESHSQTKSLFTPTQVVEWYLKCHIGRNFY